MMLTDRFVLKVRTSRRGFQLAKEYGLGDAPALSRLLWFNELIRSRDERFVRMGKALGLKEGEVFDDA